MSRNNPTVRFMLVAAVLVFGMAGSAFAADHLDAPGLTPPGGDGSLDINDVYAFQSPANPDNAVLIMTVNPGAGVLTGTTFNPGAAYRWRIDQDGDGKKDLTYTVRFGPEEAGSQSLRLQCMPANNCPSGSVLAEGRTGEVVDVQGVGVIEAGLFDDPFFFDLNAFLGANGRSFCDGGQNDFFLGLNVSAIVLEVPASWVGNGTVGVWSTTSTEDEGQVDRMGRPAINTVFIPSNPFEPNEPSQKNFFNAGKPRHDRRDFRGEILDTLEIFYGAGNATASAIADILLPDILTVDYSNAGGFLNGRQLADDVIDIELGLVTNGAVTSDCVDNDSAFSAAFPYLAVAN